MAANAVDVYVKLQSGKAISSNFLPSETVAKIASFVARQEGIPDSRVRLKYQGKTLDKTKSIGYLGIRPETILKGEVSRMSKNDCIVKYYLASFMLQHIISRSTTTTTTNVILLLLLQLVYFIATTCNSITTTTKTTNTTTAIIIIIIPDYSSEGFGALRQFPRWTVWKSRGPDHRHGGGS